MRSGKLLLGLLAAGSFASSAGAQTPRVLVKENDTIIGMGSLMSMTFVQIIDSGVWTTFIDTDFADTGRDGATRAGTTI